MMIVHISWRVQGPVETTHTPLDGPVVWAGRRAKGFRPAWGYLCAEAVTQQILGGWTGVRALSTCWGLSAQVCPFVPYNPEAQELHCSDEETKVQRGSVTHLLFLYQRNC